MANTGIRLRRLADKSNFQATENLLTDGELVFALNENEFGFLKDGNSPANITWGRIEDELPIEGTTGQVLIKRSDLSFDVEWGNELPIEGTTGQALIKQSNDDFDVEWGNVNSGGGGTLDYSLTFTETESLSNFWRMDLEYFNTPGVSITDFNATYDTKIYVKCTESGSPTTIIYDYVFSGPEIVTFYRENGPYLLSVNYDLINRDDSNKMELYMEKIFPKSSTYYGDLEITIEFYQTSGTENVISTIVESLDFYGGE